MSRLRPHTFAQVAQAATYARAFSNASRSPAEARRRAVTVVNDTGRVPWQDLSAGEKTARATQQTFNLGIILLGAAATIGVGTVMWLEVFSTDSQTAMFNKAADRVRKDQTCLQMLAGEGLHTKREISAHGEPSWSRWARNRRIASTLEKDRAGNDHLKMHFYVEGPVAKGTVQVHMIRRPGEDFEYRMLALDIPGHQRYYLENSDALKTSTSKLFGIKWR